MNSPPFKCVTHEPWPQSSLHFVRRKSSKCSCVYTPACVLFHCPDCATVEAAKVDNSATNSTGTDNMHSCTTVASLDGPAQCRRMQNHLPIPTFQLLISLHLPRQLRGTWQWYFSRSTHPRLNGQRKVEGGASRSLHILGFSLGCTETHRHMIVPTTALAPSLCMGMKI